MVVDGGCGGDDRSTSGAGEVWQSDVGAVELDAAAGELEATDGGECAGSADDDGAGLEVVVAADDGGGGACCCSAPVVGGVGEGEDAGLGGGELVRSCCR